MDRGDSVELIARLARDAGRIAAAFGLRFRAIEPERPHVRRRLGVCYADGTIRLRLHHARTGQPLKYSSLVDTLCHELAHLRHFNHGRRFQLLYRRILEHARREGIYRPGHEPEAVAPPPRIPRTAPALATVRQAPQQLALF
jgi:predicted metal-dependent hydrolase